MLQGKLAGFAVIALACVSCQKRKFNTEVSSARAGGDLGNPLCGEPGVKGAPNPAHCPGPISIDGNWGYDEERMSTNRWWTAGTSYRAGMFGATMITKSAREPAPLPDPRAPFVTRDMHYHLGGNRVGIRPIPVSENPHGTATTASGETIAGYSELDKEFRAQYQLPENAPIWGIGVSNLDGTPYVPAESLESLVRGRAGHVGTYIGRGWTRHQNGGGMMNKFWSIRQQPQTILGVSMKDTDQAVLNSNLVAMSRIMAEVNGGFNSNMPQDQINDPVGQVTLRQTLDILRAWIIGGEAIREIMLKPEFSMYCAEWVNVVLNLGLNVPLTPTGFAKVWGPQEGPKLWARLQERIQQVDANPFFIAEEGLKLAEQMPKADFIPLWEREGKSRPVMSGEPNESFAWPLETAGDAIAGAIETFGNWPTFGPFLALPMIFRVMPMAQARTGISQQEYKALAFPIATKVVAHHAAFTGMNNEAAWPQYVNGVVRQALATTGHLEQEEFLRLVDGIKPHAFQLQPKLPAPVAWQKFEEDVTAEVRAYREFRPAFSPFQQGRLRDLGIDFLQARLADAKARGDAPRVARLEQYIRVVNDRFYIRYNANPILFMRVAQGMRMSHPLIQVRAVGTVFDASLLRSKGAGAKSQYLPTELKPPQLVQ